MSSILIRSVIHEGSLCDVLIRDNKFEKIAPQIDVSADKVISCNGKRAILPPFYNAHTHAAMTLMRGYADDYELFKWLSEYIWPTEARLTREHVYHGTRLACLEMIKSGTVFFNDMYWLQLETVRAVEEMGMRACIGMLDLSTADGSRLERVDNAELLERRNSFSDRISLAFAPHAIYTVSTRGFEQTAADFEKTPDIFLHTHIAETKQEFDNCLKEHGKTPIAYLDSFGLLNERSILAHAIYLTDDDFYLVAKRGAVLVNMPASNMKLTSGAFRYAKALEHKCRVAIGTDGASSNNSLSMISEMKLAALLAKHEEKSPELLDARTVYNAASLNGAKAFGIHAGKIEAGYLADCLLVNLETPSMTPNFHIHSNMVYAADPSCIDSVICDGRILMENHYVEGEEEIISSAASAARELTTN